MIGKFRQEANGHSPLSTYTTTSAQSAFDGGEPGDEASLGEQATRAGGPQTHWARAMQAHLGGQGRISSTRLPLRFAQFDSGYAAVGELIWSIRKQLADRVVHISGPDGLVAVMAPQSRKVLMRMDAGAFGVSALSWRELPVTADLPEGRAAEQFTTTTVYELLWYFGQTVREAVLHLPESIGAAQLQLRRFPRVPPQALGLRHLVMMHAFSAGPLSFEQLWFETPGDDRGSLCADLTSFFLTGALAAARVTGRTQSLHTIR